MSQLEAQFAEHLYTVDGDTHDLMIVSRVFGMRKERGRLLEVDTPETNRLVSREAGLAAKNAALVWMKEHGPHVLVEFWKKDVYGRWLWYISAEGVEESLNDYLIRLGHSERVPIYTHAALLLGVESLVSGVARDLIEEIPVQWSPSGEVMVEALRDREVKMRWIESEAWRYGVDANDLTQTLVEHDYMITEDDD